MRVKFQIIVTDLDTDEDVTLRCEDFKPHGIVEGTLWKVFKLDDQGRKYYDREVMGGAHDMAEVEEIQYGR